MEIGDIRIKRVSRLSDVIEIAIFDRYGDTIVSGTMTFTEFMEGLFQGEHQPFEIITGKVE